MLIGTSKGLERYCAGVPKFTADKLQKSVVRCGDVWYLRLYGDPETDAELIKILQDTQRIPQEVLPDGVDPNFTSFYPVFGESGGPRHRPLPTFPEKIRSFLRATLGPTVGDEEFAGRMAACTEHGGATCSALGGMVTEVGDGWIDLRDVRITLKAGERPAVVWGEQVEAGQPVAFATAPSPCPYLLDRQDGKKFCNACGCGERDRAELTVKLRMALVSCPRVYPLFVEHKDPS